MAEENETPQVEKKPVEKGEEAVKKKAKEIEETGK